MLSNTVDFNTVELLVAVVDEGSFSAAARRVGLPVSSVSRRVAALENALAVRLLIRTTRRMALTDAGREYLERVTPAIAELRAAGAAVRQRQTQPRGRVRLTAPVGLGPIVSNVAAGVLDAFPDIVLEVALTDQLLDLVAEGFDIGIRSGRPQDTDLVADRLWTANRMLLASPAYLAGRPEITSVDDLRHHRTIATRANRGVATWELTRGETRVTWSHQPALVIDEMGALVRAARQGIGIGLLPATPYNRHLEAGDLVPVLPDWSGPSSGMWLYRRARRELSAAVSATVDHFLEHFEPPADL